MKPPRLRAPAEHLGVLAEPSLHKAPALLDLNQSLLAGADVAFTLHREEAQREALEAAAAYHGDMGEPLPTLDTHAPIILSGHQPELVHPGVWAKNFVLHGLARQAGAIPLHVLIDNDLAKTTAVRVPAGNHVGQVPYDRWQSEMPFEELRVADAQLLTSFPERLRPFIQGWPFQPLAATCWQTVVQSKAGTLGDRLAAGRRTLERAWCCHNLEVPLSRLCRTRSFARFALSLMRRADDLFRIYNDVLRATRRAWRIKSRTHPVPDLGKDGAWLEAPFWAWRAGAGLRRRLFTRSGAHTLEIRVGNETIAAFHGPPLDMVDQWLELHRQGWKVRPRALTTTWFLRLFVGDFFVHGLGGGRYDQITDQMIAAFEGRAAPRYLIVTATVRLPLTGYPNAAAEARQLARLERDLTYNADRHLASSEADARRLAEEIKIWRAKSPIVQQDRRDRFEILRRLNKALQPLLGNQLERTQAQRLARQAEAHIHDVISRRDYAFCLFPEELLREFLQRFLRADHQPTT